MSDQLEKFNEEGILDNLLAIEEHLLGVNDLEESMNQWCAKKHWHKGSGHHLDELIQLTERSDPAMSEKLTIFKADWRTLMESGASSGTVRDLRNRFRAIINDPTLGCKNKICRLDALHAKTDAATPSPPATGKIRSYRFGSNSATAAPSQKQKWNIRRAAGYAGAALLGVLVGAKAKLF